MFERILNFRDLGGLRTGDGGVLRSGLVYRSGELSKATTRDLAALRGLGLNVICDLRSTRERQRRPSPDLGVATLCFDYALEDADILEPNLDKRGSREVMIATYRAMPVVRRDLFRMVFRCLESGTAPILIHCAAGKDRTGVAVALLLRLLGVAHEVVITDYLISNHAADQLARRLSERRSEPLDPIRWGPLLCADVDYLAAALEPLDKAPAGIARYFADMFGIAPDATARLRKRLLE